MSGKLMIGGKLGRMLEGEVEEGRIRAHSDRNVLEGPSTSFLFFFLFFSFFSLDSSLQTVETELFIFNT
jgi:hypothetical protein